LKKSGIFHPLFPDGAIGVLRDYPFLALPAGGLIFRIGVLFIGEEAAVVTDPCPFRGRYLNDLVLRDWRIRF